VLAVALRTPTRDKLLANLREVKARAHRARGRRGRCGRGGRARRLVLRAAGASAAAAVVAVVPLQRLAYEWRSSSDATSTSPQPRQVGHVE